MTTEHSRKISLRYDCWTAPEKHPQEVMRELGITYQHATPQSIADQWWFWNCDGVPANLPPFLKLLTVLPKAAIGHGLSKEAAQKIEAAARKEPT